MARLYPADPADYPARMVSLWEYIRKYLIDPKHGGWFRAGVDENPEARTWPKGFPWKDCSHETEALLEREVAAIAAVNSGLTRTPAIYRIHTQIQLIRFNPGHGMRVRAACHHLGFLIDRVC